MWRIYAILSAVFAALTSIFAKVGLQEINSDLATAIRTTIILLLTWGIVFFGHKADGIGTISWQTWLFLILSGVSTGLSWLFYFKALQLGDVSRVAPIDKLSIVITILLAFIFLHEKVTLRVLIGCQSLHSTNFDSCRLLSRLNSFNCSVAGTCIPTCRRLSVLVVCVSPAKHERKKRLSNLIG